MNPERLRQPSKLLWALELPRGAHALFSLARQYRRLPDEPRGDGRPILVLPGLANSDRSNFAMRAYLNRLGYRAYGWGFGRNLGARTIGKDAARLFERIAELHRETGERVTLIGVSLGGIMARLAAHRLPDMVREVITVSSPFAGDPRATNVWLAFQWLTGERVDDPAIRALREEVAAPPPVPATAIWSASDGLVNAALCRSGYRRSVEIRSSHLGVQVQPDTLRQIALILAGGRN